MAATDDRTFARSIAEIYDRYLVPLIFDSYALDLASRLVEANPLDVLETAAGTGVLTRAIASHLPADARIVATDLNRCLIAQRDGNLRMVELSGNRQMLWHCRLRIKVLTLWPANSA